MKQPFCCPVCGGTGQVVHYFYGGGLMTWVGSCPTIPCRSCQGSGVLWGKDEPSAMLDSIQAEPAERAPGEKAR